MAIGINVPVCQQLNFQTLCIILFATLAFIEGGSEIQEKTVCTNTHMSLDCDVKRIHILDAYSGKSRHPTQTCHMTPGDEIFNNSFAAIDLWKQCNMRPNCNVFMDDGRYYTFVFIKYQCIQEIPALDICSNSTSLPLRGGHIFSPGYPRIIPTDHSTKCSCRIESKSLINLRMDIMAEELRCRDKQRLNVFSKNQKLESSYTCETFNRSPLYVTNGSDIIFEFLNKYYAAGGKFWIRIIADKPISLTCGTGSSTPILMSNMPNITRVAITDDTHGRTQPYTTQVTPGAVQSYEPSTTHQGVREVHVYNNRLTGQDPRLALVINIIIMSTVMLGLTITLYVCWQHHTRKRKTSSTDQHPESYTKVVS